MTRLNSTFRSGCKLNNRTIREEKQAGLASQPRRNSRFFPKQSRGFIDLEKSFLRTGKLFGTTLNERAKRTKKTSGEKAIRAMDVARQSSMEEGLQVQLLSWKDKPDNLISSKLKERSTHNEDGVLSKVRDELRGSNGIHNEVQINACRQKNEARLGQINGVEQIETCVRSENRTHEDTKLEENTLHEVVHDAEVNGSRNGNGLRCDNKRLKVIPKKGDYGNTVGRANGSEIFNDSHLADYKHKNVDATFMAVEKTFSSRPISLPLLTCYGKSALKAMEDKSVREGSDAEKLVADSHPEDSLKTSQRTSIVETNAACGEVVICTDASLVNDVSEPKCQKQEMCRLVVSNDNKEEGTEMVGNCRCSSMVEETSKSSTKSEEGRPKRAARSLRSRHDDDFILDVRQIPHKFKDKISTNRRENRKNVLTGGKKRKRTQKNDGCPTVAIQENAEKVEKLVNLIDEGSEDNYVNVDCVLGIRHDEKDKQQVLVQFTDGTSNWIKKSEIKSIDVLSEYFSFPDQELAAAQRLPSVWFGCQLHSWQKRPLQPSDFECCDFDDERNIVEFEQDNRYFSKNSEVWSTQSLTSLQNRTLKDSLEDFEDIFDGSEKGLGLPDGKSHSLIVNSLTNSPRSEEIPLNPIALDSLASGNDINLKDSEDMLLDTDSNDTEVSAIRMNDERIERKESYYKHNETIPSEGVPVFVSRNGELEVLQSDHIEMVLKHKDRRSKRIRSETCDNLIHQLELRINDVECHFVVINGLEEYFSSSMDMEKLIKFPCEAEKTRYDEKMANLRYCLLFFEVMKDNIIMENHLRDTSRLHIQ